MSAMAVDKGITVWKTDSSYTMDCTSFAKALYSAGTLQRYTKLSSNGVYGF
jgi:hypothetical protein